MKRKININREKVSSEEIAKRKDFNALMKGYVIVKKPFWKHWSFISGVSAVVVTAAVITIMQVNKPNENSELNNKDIPKTENKSFTYVPSENKITHGAFIAPPLEGIDVSYSNYKVDASKGSDLTYKTGSKIKIPKDAFKDENGNPVKGKVDVKYREFHDAADFFVSGIPMKYDSAGNHYTFESAGMVEMYAFQDGKVLKIAPDATIEIQMATNTDGAGYNVYNLDTAKRNWTYMGKDKIKKEKPQEMLANNQVDQVVNLQEEPFTWNGMKVSSKDKPLVDKADNVQTEIKQVKQEIVKLENTKPVQPKKANKEKRNFNIDVNAKEFPELTVYKEVFFEIGDENKEVKADMYTITWEDVVVKAGKIKGCYDLTFTKGKEKRTLYNCLPVFKDKGYDVAMNDFNKMFGDYNTKLTARKDQEVKKQAEYDNLVAQIKKQQQEYQQKMIAQQKQAEADLKKKIESMETSDKVFRVFTISGFGVYNCDSPNMYPKGADLNAYFKSEDGSKLNLNGVVYLVDRKRNALFTYQGNPVNHFEFNPKSSSIVWSVTLDKKLAVSFDEEVAGIQNKTGEATFTMKTFPKEELGSLEKLKALLKIGTDGALQ